jgi:hypothetical protein
LIPIFLKRSASFIGHTTASTNSSICLSSPPTSVYFSVGFSSTSIALTLESYSAGSVSSTKYESLFTPIRSPGLRASWSTRPISGRKIVCLVDVLMTADLPTRVASRSILAPSSAASASTSRSRSSTTLPTRYGSCLKVESVTKPVRKAIPIERTCCSQSCRYCP